jgi:hypothetical protein
MSRARSIRHQAVTSISGVPMPCRSVGTRCRCCSKSFQDIGPRAICTMAGCGFLWRRLRCSSRTTVVAGLGPAIHGLTYQPRSIGYRFCATNRRTFHARGQRLRLDSRCIAVRISSRRSNIPAWLGHTCGRSCCLYLTVFPDAAEKVVGKAWMAGPAPGHDKERSGSHRQGRPVPAIHVFPKVRRLRAAGDPARHVCHRPAD